MKWNTPEKIKAEDSKSRLEEIENKLFESRGLLEKKDQEAFLNPKLPELSDVLNLPDFNTDQLEKAKKIITETIATQKPIVVYGDYDCDGLCATTILWETLRKLGANALPFIPHRSKHGYGLSSAGLSSALELFPDQKPLIITVDNGVSASEIINTYKDQGGQIIITDHHQLPASDLKADALVHTTAMCGAGVAWALSSALLGAKVSLELVAIATICDQLPLLAINRQFVTYGLKELKNTTRPGIKALSFLAGLENTSQIETYHIGFILGPRLNAAGRLGDAMVALRLLCTPNETKAWEIAEELNSQNVARQDLTNDASQQAIDHFKQMETLPKILFLSSENYHEGVIGLIAARLTEYFARPSIVVSQGPNTAKGSARSISGVHITQVLQTTQEHLIDYGGHAQAAGLSILTSKISDFEQALISVSQDINEESLIKTLNIELEIDQKDLDNQLLNLTKKFAPFGVGNPQPVFSAPLEVMSTRRVGKLQNHLQVSFIGKNKPISAIAFNVSPDSLLETNKYLNVAFNLDENSYNGFTKLQLKLIDWQE